MSGESKGVMSYSLGMLKFNNNDLEGSKDAFKTSFYAYRSVDAEKATLALSKLLFVTTKLANKLRLDCDGAINGINEELDASTKAFDTKAALSRKLMSEGKRKAAQAILSSLEESSAARNARIDSYKTAIEATGLQYEMAFQHYNEANDINVGGATKSELEKYHGLALFSQGKFLLYHKNDKKGYEKMVEGSKKYEQFAEEGDKGELVSQLRQLALFHELHRKDCEGDMFKGIDHPKLAEIFWNRATNYAVSQKQKLEISIERAKLLKEKETYGSAVSLLLLRAENDEELTQLRPLLNEVLREWSRQVRGKSDYAYISSLYRKSMYGKSLKELRDHCSSLKLWYSNS